MWSGRQFDRSIQKNPAKLTGVDISEDMISLAKNKVPNHVSVVKTNGTKLNFEDKSFDIVFAATVLQHNTDEVMLKNLISEIW